MKATYIRGRTANISIDQGETLAMVLQFFPTAGGAPLDLSNVTLKARIDFPTPLDLTTENGGFTILDASGGIARMNAASEITAEIPPDSYPYDVWTVDGLGREKPWLDGRFVVEAATTPTP